MRLGPRRLDDNPITVAFHPRRLLDALIATGTGRARLALTTPAKPALFTPVGDSQDDDDSGLGYRHLLMPIRTVGCSQPRPFFLDREQETDRSCPLEIPP